MVRRKSNIKWGEQAEGGEGVLGTEVRNQPLQGPVGQAQSLESIQREMGAVGVLAGRDIIWWEFVYSAQVIGRYQPAMGQAEGKHVSVCVHAHRYLCMCGMVL